MQEVFIVKSSGARVPFHAERIRASVLRAGANAVQADDVVRQVVPRVKDGMTTGQVYTMVDACLRRENRCAAARYGLRGALARLGPSGFPFEKYIAALYAALGYATELPDEYEGGSGVLHEVDVVLRQNGRVIGCEVKFRNNGTDHVRLQDAMAGYARFLDLLDGAALGLCPKLHEFWIVTNSLFSDRAVKYAASKGMRLVGWRYPDGRGLAALIDRTGLYPVTIIEGLHGNELVSLSRANIMLCQDLLRIESHDIAAQTGLTLSRVEELVHLAAEVKGDVETIVAR